MNITLPWFLTKEGRLEHKKEDHIERITWLVTSISGELVIHNHKVNLNKAKVIHFTPILSNCPENIYDTLLCLMLTETGAYILVEVNGYSKSKYRNISITKVISHDDAIAYILKWEDDITVAEKIIEQQFNQKVEIL